MTGEPRAGAASAALVVAIWLACMAPLLVAGQTFGGTAHGARTAVWHQQAGEAIERGHLPEWDDRSGLGAALVGAPDRAVMYPPVWLMALGGGVLAVDLLIAGHLLLFGMGLAAWARRLGAGALASAVAGGAAVTMAGLVEVVNAGGLVYAAAWLPWIGWAGHRVATAASRRDGRVVRRRIAATCLLVAVTAAALMSGPTGAAPAAMIVAFAAIFAGAPGRKAGWIAWILLAPMALVVSAMAWWPAWLAGSMQLDSMPGAGQLVVGDVALAVALLALLPGARVGPVFRVLMVAAVCAAIGAVFESWREPLWLAARVLGWTVAGVGLSRVVAGFAARHAVWAALVVAAAVAVPCARLWSGRDTQPRARLAAPPQALAEVATGGGPLVSRLAWPRVPDPDYRDGAPLSGARFGLGYIPGDERDAELANMWRRSSGAAERFLDLYGVELVMVPASVATPASLPVLGRTSDGTWVVARNQTHRPRAFVAQNWLWHPSMERLIGEMFPTAPDQRTSLAMGTVRLLGHGPDPVDQDGPVPAPPCRITADRVEEIVLDCESRRGGYAVLLDRFAPGWTATVNGKPAAIEHADGLVRAVAIDSGPQRIVFRYRSPGLAFACVVSGLGAACLLILGLLVTGKRTRTVTAKG